MLSATSWRSSGAPGSGTGYGINAGYHPYLGAELDLVAGVALTKFANLELGYAHFFRGEVYVLVVLYVGLAGMLAVPRHWARRTVQVALLLGVLEWLSLIARTVPVRVAQGQPYHRYVVIIGGTAAFALLGALLLQTARWRRRCDPAPSLAVDHPAA